MSGEKQKTKFYLCKVEKGRIKRGDWGDRPSKTYKSNFVHHDFMILCNSKNNIRNSRTFCRPFFCHNIIMKYTSYFL